MKLIKARLKILVDNHYVAEDWIPTRLLCSPYYYTLSPKGVEYLQELGMDINKSYRVSKEVSKHHLFIQHALELNDVIIAAAILKRKAPEYYLEGFIHERDLKQRPFRIIWRGEKFTVIPDAFLNFRCNMPDGNKLRIPILLEHDWGTAQQLYFSQRIRAYIVLLKTEAYKSLLDMDAITIAFTTFAGPQRLEKMREWATRIVLYK